MARRLRSILRARKSGAPSGMWKNRVELVLRQRPLAQPELDRNVEQPAGREAAIEMPQSRNDHAHDRNVDVGARLIEDEKIEALALRELHAGGDLLARVETAELFAEAWLEHGIAMRRQERMVAQAQR